MTSQKVFTSVLLVVLTALVVVSIYGLRSNSKARVEVDANIDGGKGGTLFVLIHGLAGNERTWEHVIPTLKAKGDVLPMYFDGSRISNVDPEDLSRKVAEEVDARVAKGRYNAVVIVGYSAGALVARRAYLIGAAKNPIWERTVTRIVLLAGMNRGWDITGKRPLDMSQGKRLMYWFGSWFGRLANRGRFILGTEMGAPFVANLRLEWMRHMREHAKSSPLVVQLLGDIDDVVSDDDNKDIGAAGTSRFYWLRVRGTGHENIMDFGDLSGRTDAYPGIGPYRSEKFMLAVTGGDLDLTKENEELPAASNPNVRHVVFVLHGIRDLGEWSGDFERELRARSSVPPEQLAVVSIRYGYFSMASFLLRPDRQKYVRWFMDQYTETLARFPQATAIDFIGHSNGTYLLASALSQYSALKIRRVVFAGSVVRQDFDWPRTLAQGQVKALRNYVATEDAVVALFPRFFEPEATRWMGNDVGSAGFSGFTNLPPTGFANVTISGGHGAFLTRVPEITQFVVAADASPTSSAPAAREPGLVHQLLNVHSKYAFPLVWIFLVALIGLPAIRVTVAGGSYGWIPLFLYGALVIALLKRL